MVHLPGDPKLICVITRLTKKGKEPRKSRNGLKRREGLGRTIEEGKRWDGVGGKGERGTHLHGILEDGYTYEPTA